MARRWNRWLALVPALLLPALGVWPDAAFSERGPLRPLASAAAEDAGTARVIVKYRSGASLLQASPKRPLHAARLSERLSLPLADGRMLGERTQSLRGQGLSSQQLVARLTAQPDVEWAVVDRRRTINAVVPNDPYFADGQTSITPTVGQWYLRTPDGSMPAAINALGAWAFTTGAGSVTVAVIDTGVRLTHPDLAGKLWPGYDFVADTSTANDGDGRDADPSDPGDWTVTFDSCSSGDSSWHGTQVAGLIGAGTDNGIGMASVGRNVMVLPVRVLGKCGGYDSDIIAGMRWAAGVTSQVGANGASVQVSNAHPARVINLSLGSSGSCSASYRDAIAEIVAAGVTVVVAAGNDTGHAVSEPANCAGVIAVAGMRHIGTKVGYSNIGPEVAISAPAGNCVNVGDNDPCLYPLLTTINSGTTVPSTNTYSDSFNASLGTSFAAPIVAGTVALMLSADPTLAPTQIKSKLQATSRGFPAYSIGATTTVPACHAPTGVDQLECLCTTNTCGAGLLDAAAAVAAAANGVAPPLALIVASTGAPSAGSPVALQGTASSRSVTGYQWTLSAGADKAAFVGATTGGTATLLPSAAGSVTVSLRVSDSSGATASTSQTFNVAASNAPTALIMASSVAPTVGTSISLDGSGSSAVTGSITGYNWAITSGAGRASISSATNASTATLLTTGAGTVVVSLTVTDSAGISSTTTQTINVMSPPVAVVAASSTTPTAGNSVTLDGSGSTAAAGRSIVGWQWAITSGDTLATLSGATNASTATLLTSAAGTVVLGLTVTDSAGATSTSAQTITVAAAPVVVNSSGGGGGALGGGWLAGLALAVGLLWHQKSGQRLAQRRGGG
jgi:serine protease